VHQRDAMSLSAKLRFVGYTLRLFGVETEVDPALMHTHAQIRYTHTRPCVRAVSPQSTRPSYTSIDYNTHRRNRCHFHLLPPSRTRVASRLPPVPSYSSSFHSWNSHLYSQSSKLSTTPDPINLQVPVPASLDGYIANDATIVEHEQLLNYLDAKLLFTDDAFRLMNLM
jgi:hypothetical protein